MNFKNKTLTNIIYNQKIATEKVFEMKKIPFRSFNILKRDEKTLGDVSAKFKVRNYPTGTETTHPSSGSFALANPTDVRFTAREVKFRVETARNADWRVGNMQMFVRAGGGRG